MAKIGVALKSLSKDKKVVKEAVVSQSDSRPLLLVTTQPWSFQTKQQAEFLSCVSHCVFE